MTVLRNGNIGTVRDAYAENGFGILGKLKMPSLIMASASDDGERNIRMAERQNGKKAVFRPALLILEFWRRFRQ